MFWPIIINKFQDSAHSYILLLYGILCLTHALNLLFYGGIEYLNIFEGYRVNKKSVWQVEP